MCCRGWRDRPLCIYNLRLPFEIILLTCKSRHISDYIIKARRLVSLTTSSFSPAMYRSGGDGDCILKQICITLYFVWLQFAQASRSRTSRSIWDGLWAWQTSVRLRSSTYLKLGDWLFGNIVNEGYEDKWTTLGALGDTTYEKFPIRQRGTISDPLTSERQKVSNPWDISLLTPRVQNFWMARVWSTQSKALGH